MGVLGLWQLLAPVGQPVTLESLENKILAVDISIWLNQALKGYRDGAGGAVNNAHLLSLFTRLCKLLYYKIRPIMVFDGGVPELKRKTIINRQQRRAALKQSSRAAGLKLLANFMAMHGSPKGKLTKNSFMASKHAIRDELYVLPPLEKDSHYHPVERPNDDPGFMGKALSCDELKYIEGIDIESKDFEDLPADIKQEILATFRENRRRKNWEYYETLPKESNEFSNYQMQCLLKRRKIQTKIEELQRDMQKSHYMDIISMYSDEPDMVGGASRIMSDECSHYVYLKRATKDEVGAGVSTITENELEKKERTKCDGISSDPEQISRMSKSNAFDALCEIDTLSDEEMVEGDIDYESEADCHTDEKVFDDRSGAETIQVVEKHILSEKQAEVNYVNRDTEVDDHIAPQTNTTHIKLQPENASSKSVDAPLDVVNAQLVEDTIKMPSVHQMQCEHPSTVSHLQPVRLDQTAGVSSDKVNSYATPSVCSDGHSSDSEKGSTEGNHLKIDVNYHVEDKVVNMLSHSSNSEKGSTEGNHLKIDVNYHVEDEVVNMPSHSSNSEKGSTRGNHLKIDVNYNVEDEVVNMPSTSAGHFTLQDELSSIEMAVQQELQEASSVLRAQQAKKDRQAATVQEHMVEECQELLRLFGVPYIVSPLEAEAQCAFFDLNEVTHGTITDDSDIWLFGGRNVYKNFFAQKKYVEFYKDSEISAHFGLNRSKLINFALLTGSDYTEGIETVGPVTAMEIISEFSSDGIDALVEFKRWWQEVNKHASPPKNKVRAKLQRLRLSESFPNETIFEAYLKPEVDDSTESFSWGLPDLDSLRDYAREKFGWNKVKVDDALLPVLKRLSERTAQMHLDSYFKVTLKKEKNLFPSKRIMSALRKINPASEGECDDPKPKCAKTVAKSKKTVSTRKNTSVKSRVKRNAKPSLQLSEDSSSDTN